MTMKAANRPITEPERCRRLLYLGMLLFGRLAIALLAVGAALVWAVLRLLARLENRVESPATAVPPVDGKPA